MNCKEAAECVSALFDGEPISREVAAHLSDCPECRVRFNEYAEMGSELRDVASAVTSGAIPEGQWRLTEPAAANNWLRKWRGTMRIPRFAFALMLIAIFALSGGLALVKARPGEDGPAVLLTFKLPRTGQVSHCTFDTRKVEGQSCSHGTGVGVSGYVSFSARYVKREADRVQLAIKALYSQSNTGSRSSDGLMSAPEEEYWLEPDRVLGVEVSGLGTMEISGQFLDYMPAMPQRPAEPLDPGRDEFRLWHPVLICENRVVADLSGFSTTDTGNDAATWLYAPGLGRFVFSSVPFEGATEGKIQISQISFTLAGKSYRVLTGAPISRTERVWVLHQPDWKSTSVFGSGNLRTVLESK